MTVIIINNYILYSSYSYKTKLLYYDIMECIQDHYSIIFIVLVNKENNHFCVAFTSFLIV